MRGGLTITIIIFITLCSLGARKQHTKLREYLLKEWIFPCVCVCACVVFINCSGNTLSVFSELASFTQPWGRATYLQDSLLVYLPVTAGLRAPEAGLTQGGGGEGGRGVCLEHLTDLALVLPQAGSMASGKFPGSFCRLSWDTDGSRLAFSLLRVSDSMCPRPSPAGSGSRARQPNGGSSWVCGTSFRAPHTESGPAPRPAQPWPLASHLCLLGREPEAPGGRGKAVPEETGQP